MKLLFEYLDRLEKIHSLIKNKNTGTPTKFAKALHVTSSRLYTILNELKSQGTPISYSRSLQTYYYTHEFEIHITCSFSELSEKEKVNDYGGYFVVQQNRIYPLAINNLLCDIIS